MKIQRLTKREIQVMEILWNSPTAISAGDVQAASDRLSIYTIHQVLQHLLSMEYIRICGFTTNKKSLTRLYAPTLSESEYVSSFIREKSLAELALNYIRSNEDMDTLNELEKLIAEKKKELEKK